MRRPYSLTRPQFRLPDELVDHYSEGLTPTYLTSMSAQKILLYANNKDLCNEVHEFPQFSRGPGMRESGKAEATSSALERHRMFSVSRMYCTECACSRAQGAIAKPVHAGEEPPPRPRRINREVQLRGFTRTVEQPIRQEAVDNQCESSLNKNFRRKGTGLDRTAGNSPEYAWGVDRPMQR